MERAQNENKLLLIRGRVWNWLIDHVKRLSNITVASPLSLRNDRGGIQISLDHPIPQLVKCVIHAPVITQGEDDHEDTDQAGRFDAFLIDGEARGNATGGLVAEDLGRLEDDQKAPYPPTFVRVWNSSRQHLPAGTIVWGWMLGTTDAENRPIVLVSHAPTDWFYGKIKTVGPTAEMDFNDGRHWFVRVNKEGTGVFTELDPEDPDYVYGVLENLTGAAGTTSGSTTMGMHVLRTGDIVRVQASRDQYGIPHYVTHMTPHIETGEIKELGPCPYTYVTVTDAIGKDVRVYLRSPSFGVPGFPHIQMEVGDELDFIRFLTDEPTYGTGLAVSPAAGGWKLYTRDEGEGKSAEEISEGTVDSLVVVNKHEVVGDENRKDFDTVLPSLSGNPCIGNVNALEWNGIDVEDDSASPAIKTVRKIRYCGPYPVPTPNMEASISVTDATKHTVDVKVLIPFEEISIEVPGEITGFGTSCDSQGNVTITSITRAASTTHTFRALKQ